MAARKVDPIRAEVVARYLLATSEEMAATLMRTAFSPNIKERGDCSSAIFDARGQVIALAHRIPIHLGSMVGAVDEIRIPPVRIMSAGKVNRDVLDIVLLNTRTPDERICDLKAQFAANPVGVRGVEALFRRYGNAGTESTIAAYLDFTEKRFRAAIDGLTPGVYEAEDSFDGDREGELARIRLKLEVGRGRLEFDFSESDAQIHSARNIPHRAVLATIYTVAKSLLDPDVPANAGYYRTIKVTGRDATVVQPIAPAPIGARAISSAVLGDVVAAALTQAMPHRALSRSGPHHLVVTSGSDPRSGNYFVSYETLAGGKGARAYRDGMDGVRVHASGSSSLPIEALENAYPMRVERYELWQDSAGPGKYRGGMGVLRDYRMLGQNMVISLSSERQHVAAAGMEGGAAGKCGAFILNPGSAQAQKLPSAAGEIPLPQGSVLRICTPAGGGYGEPAQRDRNDVARDVREERLGREAAARIYAWRETA